ncbi:hypothetical protein [Acinetobacter pittii]|uniref:hypothetical protein n=1 Tax=Acinetobacter pittii TaxID=48296 RepID=UPI0024DE4518|nr:hypothetical protein [Acinetobacter pittii]
MSAELKNTMSSLLKEVNEIKEQEDLQAKLESLYAQIHTLNDKNFAAKLNAIKSQVATVFNELGFTLTKKDLPEKQEEYVFSYSNFVFKFVYPDPLQGYLGYRSVIEVHVSQNTKKQEYRMGIFGKKGSELNVDKLPLVERIQALEEYLSSYTAKSYDVATVNILARQQDLLVTDLDQFTDHIDVILKDFKK